MSELENMYVFEFLRKLPEVAADVSIWFGDTEWIAEYDNEEEASFQASGKTVEESLQNLGDEIHSFYGNLEELDA